MKVAFLFPGQGSQEVGMGAAFAAASPAARAVYDNASAAVGFDVAELCFEGPIERLSADRDDAAGADGDVSSPVSRPSAKPGSPPTSWIGHSVGEYAALVAADALSADDAMVLVRERGLATAEARARRRARWQR